MKEFAFELFLVLQLQTSEISTTALLQTTSLFNVVTVKMVWVFF